MGFWKNLFKKGKSEVAPDITYEEVQTLSNQEKAIAVLNDFVKGEEKSIKKYISEEKFIQHNLTLADGIAGMMAVLPSLAESHSKIEIQRVFEDGDMVFLHSKYTLYDDEQAAFDIFRFEDGLIVEHWDNFTPICEANASGHTQFDGETEIKDLDKTMGNKALISNFIAEVLSGEDPEALHTYFEENHFIQHSPGLSDGIEGLTEALESASEDEIQFQYEDTHLILGQGNFVLCVNEGRLGDAPVALYNLFRIENDKIVEHWDVTENIIEPADCANSNGKF